MKNSENSYYITKNGKKVDSFYLNEYPVNYVYPTEKTPKNLEKDRFGQVEILKPLKMFPIRKNSAIFFYELTDANDYLNYAKESIKKDERFCDRIKKEILKYIDSFEIKLLKNDVKIN